MGSRNLKEISFGYVKEISTGAGMVLKSVASALFRTSDVFRAYMPMKGAFGGVSVRDLGTDDVFVHEDQFDEQPYRADEQYEEQVTEDRTEQREESWELCADEPQACEEAAPVAEAATADAGIFEVRAGSSGDMFDFLPPMSEPLRRSPSRMDGDADELTPVNTVIEEASMTAATVDDIGELTPVNIEVSDVSVPAMQDGMDELTPVNIVIEEVSMTAATVDDIGELIPVNTDVPGSAMIDHVEELTPVNTPIEAVPAEAVMESTEELTPVNIINVMIDYESFEMELASSHAEDTHIFEMYAVPFNPINVTIDLGETVPVNPINVFIEDAVPVASELSIALPSEVLAAFDEQDSQEAVTEGMMGDIEELTPVNMDVQYLPASVMQDGIEELTPVNTAMDVSPDMDVMAGDEELTPVNTETADVCVSAVYEGIEELTPVNTVVEVSPAETAAAVADTGGIGFSFFPTVVSESTEPMVSFTWGQIEEDEEIVTISEAEETDTVVSQEGVFVIPAVHAMNILV